MRRKQSILVYEETKRWLNMKKRCSVKHVHSVIQVHISFNLSWIWELRRRRLISLFVCLVYYFFVDIKNVWTKVNYVKKCGGQFNVSVELTSTFLTGNTYFWYQRKQPCPRTLSMCVDLFLRTPHVKFKLDLLMPSPIAKATQDYIHRI